MPVSAVVLRSRRNLREDGGGVHAEGGRKEGGRGKEMEPMAEEKHEPREEAAS